MVGFLKAVAGWGAVAVLVVFMIANTQLASVHLLVADVDAPLSIIVLLAALAGAFGAHGFRVALSWTRKKNR
ncbi:MAG: DUF1049 domain-containing protein [Deltaproteobacteria bacterium]|nr:MAG: DUF1049 domain-containing protein [Deltaproteobacteria bacterium]